METICEIHDEIIDKAWNKFYRWRLELIEDIDELRDIISDMEWYFSDIYDLTKQAKAMWNTMEAWLSRRKDFMEEHSIETLYQESK